MIIPVVITVYSDRSFTLHHEDAARVSVLLKKAAGLPTGKKPGAGSKEPNKNKVGKVTDEADPRARQLKMQDMNATNLEAAMRSIAGTARSMGIDIVRLSRAKTRARRIAPTVRACARDLRHHGPRCGKRWEARRAATKREGRNRRKCRSCQETREGRTKSSTGRASTRSKRRAPS